MISLFLTAVFQQAMAQTSCVVNGITITAAGTVNAGAYFTPTAINSCSTTPYTGNGEWTGGQTTTGTLTYTFSSPVTSARIGYSSVNGAPSADVGVITVNGGGVVSLYNPCGVSISGTTITCTFAPNAIIPTQSTVGDVQLTVSSTLPFTSVTIRNSGGLSGWVNANPCDFILTPPCVAGTTAPTLSAITKANVCPATTVDLTTITASNTPAGTTLTWHTATPATTANEITGTAVAAGTYHAAFFDATANCYSGTSGSGSATRAVTATVSTCTTPVTVGTPASITGSTGTLVTGNPPTGVTGGTSPYTYADGTGDALCTAPTSPILALPAGRIVSLNGSTGAHNINTVGLGAGTYQYCIKVCDSSGTNCVISRHTIVVTAACNAGSAAPALIKN